METTHSRSPLRQGRGAAWRLVAVWLVTGLALLVSAAILPDYSIHSFAAALAAAALIAIFNTLGPPLIAALPLPFPLLSGFLVTLLFDAAMLKAAAAILGHERMVVSSWWAALLAALVATAVALIIGIVLGIDNEEAQALRLARRIGRRSSDHVQTNEPGVVFLEIDGLGMPVLRRALRDGSAPNMAAWVASGRFKLMEWETDLSSQTGASQAGILLGSNEDIPAFRWVEKETGRIMTCSAPADCEEIERRHLTSPLLAAGGSSRGNLLSGGADHAILTVSKLSQERGANPGYRAFFANGINATRTLAMFTAEVIREIVASRQAVRRGVLPRGHRGGSYPFIRATMTVAVRDLIVHSVVTDMMIGRPCIYATFSSYDEVAHHSGLERVDTMEALRRLDERIGRIERASRVASRPYHVVVLSDHGQTQGATFKQRNGYTLEELVERSMGGASVAGIAGGDEQNAMAGFAMAEATGGAAAKAAKRPKGSVGDRDAVVLASGNLGLVYLMSEKRRLPLEEIEEHHPELIPALVGHPHIAFVLVRSATRGAVVLGADGANYLDEGRVEGSDPLADFPPNAAVHLKRTDGFEHVADIMVNSFYDPDMDEGCAFEELISFHGGLGGAQTRPFLLFPDALAEPSHPILGAAAVNKLLLDWRRQLGPRDRPAEPVALAAD
jgi:uncharacterized membrane protein YvlD (DUF360 family)